MALNSNIIHLIFIAQTNKCFTFPEPEPAFSIYGLGAKLLKGRQPQIVARVVTLLTRLESAPRRNCFGALAEDLEDRLRSNWDCEVRATKIDRATRGGRAVVGIGLGHIDSPCEKSGTIVAGRFTRQAVGPHRPEARKRTMSKTPLR